MKVAPIRNRTVENGFSALELLIVVAIILVLSAISIPFFYNYTRLYKSEDEALKLMDNMREASQLALAKRRTFRLEIDITDNTLLIIDENGAAADTLVKSIPLENTLEVRMDKIPNGVTKPVPPNFANAAFIDDALGHKVGATTVINHKVWAARFNSDGSVVTAANLPVNVNLYVWPPSEANSDVPRNKVEVRSLTIFGSTGAVRYWKHNGTSFVPY